MARVKRTSEVSVMRVSSQDAAKFLTFTAAGALLIIGAAVFVFWSFTPDPDVGELFDRVRPYLPLHYG